MMCTPRGDSMLPLGRDSEVGGEEGREGVLLLLRTIVEPDLSAGLGWFGCSVARVRIPKVGKVVIMPGATPLTPVSRGVERGE